MARPALFTHRRQDFLAHLSFTPSEAEGSLATFPVTPLFATDPRNLQLTPLFATHPRMGSCKSFVCHTYDTPPGGCVPSFFFPVRNEFDSRIAGKRGCLSSATSHQSPTSQESRVTHRSHCAGYRAVPQLASYAKCWETKPLPSVSKEGERTGGPAKAQRRGPADGRSNGPAIGLEECRETRVSHRDSFGADFVVAGL